MSGGATSFAACRHEVGSERFGTTPRTANRAHMSTALIALVLTAGLAPADAQGQGRGRGNAETVSVSRLSDLAFGPVVGGIPAVVRPDDSAAAQFEVKLRGNPPHTVTVTLALPRELLSGPNRLPIRFDATSAAWATRDAPNNRTVFDPARGATVTLDQRGPKAILVWLGGVLEPSTSQPAGEYADRITIQALETEEIVP